MYRALPYILFFVFLPFLSFAQEFNYAHYDMKDGLAGSTVYDMCQDKDGFIWLATESGLSRFDGTHFRNFTVKDGLPDNEVLKLFADSKGRIWIGTFSKKLAYYYHGKIYGPGEDPLLKKIQFNSSFYLADEASDGTILLTDQTMLNIILPQDSVIVLSPQEIFGIKTRITLGKTYWGQIGITGEPMITRKVFMYKSGRDLSLSPIPLALVRKINDSVYRVSVHQLPDGSFDKETTITGDIITQETNGAWVEFLNTNNGSWQLDTTTLQWKNHFLPGKKITHVLRDNEDCLWFSTNAEGLYRLPSTEIRTITASFDKFENKEIFSIAKWGDKMAAGAGFSKGILVSKNGNWETIDLSAHMKYSGNTQKNNRLYSMKGLSNGDLIICCDGFLADLRGKQTLVNYSFAIKGVDELDKDHIVVATSLGATTMRLSDLQIVDSLWQTRTTKILSYRGSIYIGTLDGLYELDSKKAAKNLSSIHPFLGKRINDMKVAGDGTIWVATSDNGLIAYRNGKIDYLINDANGLSSNICKSLFIQGSQLWVGTNKGLNKIDISLPEHHIIKYSVSDGLPSDVINAVYVEDSIVWVGTPAGLTHFNEKKISDYSTCNLKLLGLEVSGRPVSDSNFNLSWNDNDIRLEYVAISFKSGGEITYHYRLKGLDNEWKKTSNTTLSYPTLPTGVDYELELYAVNKYDKKSETIRVKFHIATPFWKAWWFYTLLGLSLLGLIIWFLNRRNRIIQARLRERNHMQKQFAALEQQALQSQMNPHFIFNCLNSIQQHILTNDKEKANQYLTGFAALVRQTLDNSEKSTITIAEEMEYLHKYLEMEKMRFGDFSYTIAADPGVRTDYEEIPALLLQPYVENSLRHGIRYRPSGGAVAIRFSMEDETVVCSIHDNGVGRKKAAEYKGQQHIEYQSKGMTLTQKRIDLLNKMYATNITVAVNDLVDDKGEALGTEVIVKIPL